MVPPQDRPTFQAVSSATPNSSIFGWPLAITSSASVTTAPSTQPPETEPKNVPSSLMTRLDPAGRGAEPQVSTTVASATPWPAFCQSSAALRISSSRLSMTKPRSGYGADQAAMVRRRRRRKRPDQPFDRTQVMHRAEFVNVRQHHFDALRLGFEAAKAQERVEPDQPAAGAVQPVHLEGELVVGLALQPVGDQEHNGALPEHTARPQLVEGVQGGGDAGAAGPILHRLRTACQRLVRILGAQCPRHVGQPRAKQEDGDALAVVGDGMEEMQEQPRVLAHRSGDVEQRHDRRRLLDPPELSDIDDLAR